MAKLQCLCGNTHENRHEAAMCNVYQRLKDLRNTKRVMIHWDEVAITYILGQVGYYNVAPTIIADFIANNSRTAILLAEQFIDEVSTVKPKADPPVPGVLPL